MTRGVVKRLLTSEVSGVPPDLNLQFPFTEEPCSQKSSVSRPFPHTVPLGCGVLGRQEALPSSRVDVTMLLDRDPHAIDEPRPCLQGQLLKSGPVPQPRGGISHTSTLSFIPSRAPRLPEPHWGGSGAVSEEQLSRQVPSQPGPHLPPVVPLSLGYEQSGSSRWAPGRRKFEDQKALQQYEYQSDRCKKNLQSPDLVQKGMFHLKTATRARPIPTNGGFGLPRAPEDPANSSTADAVKVPPRKARVTDPSTVGKLEMAAGEECDIRKDTRRGQPCAKGSASRWVIDRQSRSVVESNTRKRKRGKAAVTNGDYVDVIVLDD